MEIPRLHGFDLGFLYHAALLVAHEDGATVREIAEQAGVSKSTIQRWIQAARERREAASLPHPKVVMPLQLTPESTCPKQDAAGNCGVCGEEYCVCCHRVGFPNHPALKRSPKTDPPRPTVYCKSKLAGGVGVMKKGR